MKLSQGKAKNYGIWLGPLVGLLVFAVLPNAYGDGVPFAIEGRWTAAVAVWMAVWWLSECVPIPVTALIPIAVFPLLNIASISEAAAPYANEVIYLFFGGFVLSIAMEKWNLHTRIALTTLKGFGVAPSKIVMGFMVVTAVLSMWVSNTATAVMMLPIATSVLALFKSKDNPSLEAALLLGIAYAASIGGVGTIIGTPPNVFLVSFVEANLNTSISFVKWMAIGIPFVLVMLPITWWMLTHVLYRLGTTPIPGAAETMREEHAKLGKMTRPEWTVFIVFITTALAWVFRPLLIENLTDSGIAMIAVVVLFILPSGKINDHRILDWPSLNKMPWGILLLFGGGLSLAQAIQVHKVGDYLGFQASLLADVPTIVMILIIVAAVVFLTELTSNTATTATLLPILAGVALGANVPGLMLLIPTAIAASCAFMMPVATPPNAVVFGSGRITMGQMSRAGLALNCVVIVVIVVFATFWIPVIF